VSSARDYELLASIARDKASFAMHQGNPVSAREWIEAAEAAERAAQADEPPPLAADVAADVKRIADGLENLATEIVARTWLRPHA
jgi:hypothetical protein